MARVRQHRRTGDLHRQHQGGSADARPNPDGKKLARFASIFSPEDDVRILGDLSNYVAKQGKRPGPSELRIALKDFLEKAEYTDTQIYEKVRRLKHWYLTKHAAGGVHGNGVATEATKYELSTKIWGNEEAPEPEQPKLDSKRRAERRDLEEMRSLFANLAVIVDEIATKSTFMLGEVYKRKFELMDDEKAAELEAKVEKQRIKECKMARYREILSIRSSNPPMIDKLGRCRRLW